MRSKLIALFTFLIVGIAHQALGQTKFPIKVSKNKRFLTQANGTPFFYQADTPWHIFFDLNFEDAEYYIKRRKEQGFNTLQIMLTGAKGQVNLEGESPFLGDHDFTQPNEKFFSRVDQIIEIIQEYNMYIAIVPLWAGCCRGDMAGVDREGKPLPMLVNGAENTYQFGKWLGQRYGKEQNIMWIIGGDNDPFGAPDEYAALVRGLKETTANQLFTYHAASTHSSTDVYPDAAWLDVSMIYTYFRGFNKAWNSIQPDVYEVAFDEYMKNKLPFFLGESNYEREHDSWGSATQVRKQAYWTALRGGTGHAYGSVNWKIPDNWRDMLELEGARTFKHMLTVMEVVDFESLEPDWLGEFIMEGAGEYGSNDYAVAAYTKGKVGAIVYIPSGRSIKLDQDKLSVKAFSAAWFNPRTGDRFDISISNKNIIEATTPTEDDWILLVNIR
ncbi:MAG: DUF4038 domain-containing protein [Bacteroidota bacterium]